jgi:hypothetical protein
MAEAGLAPSGKIRFEALDGLRGEGQFACYRWVIGAKAARPLSSGLDDY